MLYKLIPEMEGFWSGKGESYQHQKCMTTSNYWMSLSMISWVITTEVWVIHQAYRLRLITQLQGFLILYIMQKPNSVVILLYIFLKKNLQKKALLSKFAKVKSKTQTWCLETKQTLNLTWWLNICSRYWVIMSASHAIIEYWLHALNHSEFS